MLYRVHYVLQFYYILIILINIIKKNRVAFRQLPVICPQLPAALIGQIGALKKGINIYIVLYYWCSMSYSMMADDSISEEKGCHLDRCVAGWDVYPVNVYILACLNFKIL